MKHKNRFIILLVLSLLVTGCSPKINNDTIEVIEKCKFINIYNNVNDNGRFYESNGTTMYCDFNTFNSVPICAESNCTHTTSDCSARMVNGCPIEYNGYIYYLKSESSITELKNGERQLTIKSKLYRISMETSELEVVSEFEGVDVHTDTGYVLNGDELYFTGSDLGATLDVYGNIVTSNVGGTQFICSVNLKSGEFVNYGVIYDGDKDFEMASHSRNSNIRGFSDSKIFIYYSFIERKLTEKEIENEVDEFTGLGFEFDMNSKEIKQSELPPPRCADETVYVGYDIKSKKATVIYNGNTVELDAEIRTNATFANGKLFAPDVSKWYDVNDGSEHEMKKYRNYICIDYFDNYYIFVNGKETVKLTEDELLSLDKE